MLFALIYKEIQKLILKLNEKDFYICYLIGFVLYGILLVCSEDIGVIFELIITFGFAGFTNIIASIITGITKFIFEQIFPKKEEKPKKQHNQTQTTKTKKQKKRKIIFLFFNLITFFYINQLLYQE